MSEKSVGASRRKVLQAGLVVLASGAAVRVRAQDKIAQTDVLYQPEPNGDQKCLNCLHWQPPNACALVAGEISPEGWCGVWAPKG